MVTNTEWITKIDTTVGNSIHEDYREFQKKMNI